MPIRIPVLFSVVLALAAGLAVANDSWLEAGLPPLGEARFEVAEIAITRNHVEQEILRATVRRAQASIVGNPAQELRFVMLPAHGGRNAIGLGRSLLISPRREESFNSVVGGMLDYRGKVAPGVRVYLELRPSGRLPGATTAPQRVSKVYWLGTDEQLAAAVKAGPPPKVESGDKVKSRTVPVPASLALPKGMFLKALLGGQTRPVTVWEDAGPNQPVVGLIYLARPGKLYLPWIATLDRESLNAEPEALDELKSNPGFFSQRYQEVNARVLRGKAPPKLLESAIDKKIVVGQKLLAFALGGLDSVEVLEPVSNGTVKVSGGRLRKSSELPLAAVYLDPDADEPGTAVAAKPTQPEPAKKNSAKGNSATKKGSPLLRVRFRTWTDASGEFKVEAVLVKVDEDSVTLRRKDGKVITIPVSRLSKDDQELLKDAAAKSKNPFDP
jgi:hypothetical protein